MNDFLIEIEVLILGVVNEFNLIVMEGMLVCELFLNVCIGFD